MPGHSLPAALTSRAKSLVAWTRERGWRWPELPVLVALVSLATAGWCFVELADEVAGGDTRHFDEWLLDALRDPEYPALPIGPRWLNDAARDVTALGSTTVLTLVVAAATGYLLLVGFRRGAVLLVAAVVSAALLSSTLKVAFDRPRPPHGSELQGTLSASFPSGHSLSSAVVYLTLGALLARYVPNHRLRVYLIAVALFLTLAIGTSRVYLGVHYPTDVLAGWAAGAAWALLWWLIARYTWPAEQG